MFSFDPSLTDKKDEIRVTIRDIVVAPGGVLPNGDNISDEQIALVLANNGGDANLAVAELANTIAVEWAKAPIKWSADGLSVERVKTSDFWLALAKAKRGSAEGAANVGQSLGMSAPEYVGGDGRDEYARHSRFTRI